MKRLNKNYYKGRYIIAFYDCDDETPLYTFDNIKEVCEFKKLEINIDSYNNIRIELYRALNKRNHSTRMLNGKPMFVYLIDMYEEDEIIF